VGVVFAAGRPLNAVVVDLWKFYETMQKFKQAAPLATFVPWMQYVLNFMGACSDPLVLTGKVVDEEAALKIARETDNITVISIFVHCKLGLAYFLRIYDQANKMSKAWEQLNIKATSPYGFAAHLLYQALTAAHFRDFRMIRRKLKCLRKVGRHAGCNVAHKIALIQAEWFNASSRGTNISEQKRARLTKQALECYHQSIELAGKEGFLHEEALAHELAGFALQARNEDQQALTCLKQACSLYKQWGGTIKVNQLEEMIESATGPNTDQTFLSSCDNWVSYS